MEIKWIKVSTDLFANRKIRLIESMEDRDTIIVIWLKLMILAGEINDGGLVYLTPSMPYTAESLAVQMNRKPEEVQKALSLFEGYGMVDVNEEGMILIPNWEVYQNLETMEKIREQNRARQKTWYDKHKKASNNPNDVSLTLGITHPNARDKKRIDKNRLDKKEDSKEKTIAESDPSDLLKMLTKKMNNNAIYGTDKEVNS